MPVLKNARHEKFAQAIAKGKTADEAYVEAGYSFNRGNAARMKANESIRKRAEQITARVSEKAEWSAADRLISLKALHDASLKDDRRTAIAAIAEANKMQGSYAPTKHQHAGANGGPIQTVDLTNVSADDLDRLETLFGPLAGGPGDDDEGDTGGEGTESSGA
jgi:phage terminase small subunit